MDLVSLFFFILSLSWVGHSMKFGDDPVVSTSGGFIRGMNTETGTVFFGVPYAQPPVGDLRWKAPNPPNTWKGVRNTTRMAPWCYQAVTMKVQPPISKRQTIEMSEDCLYMNIYVPPNTEGQLPVMVWIHGGGWSIGTPNSYAGEILAANQSVIVITIAYRLNVFGFLVLPEFMNGPLNFGMLDQQLALWWVQKNIKNFGGDPSRVTIFGESAGGGSVALHLVMKESWQYYSHAILESPGMWQFNHANKSAELGLHWASTVGCTNSSSSVLSCLMAKNASSLTAKFAYLSYMFIFMPCIEGVQVTATPLTLFERGEFNHVPVLMGSNLNEGNSLTLLLWLYVPSVPVTDEQFMGALQWTWGDEAANDIASWYAELRESQGNWAALSAIMGDSLISCGALYASQAIARYTTVHRYLFAHAPAHWILSFLNCTHIAEIGFVFNNPAANYMSSFTEEEIPFAYQMSSLWGEFARTGNVPDQWSVFSSPDWNVLLLNIPLTFQHVNVSNNMCSHWMPFFV